MELFISVLYIQLLVIDDIVTHGQHMDSARNLTYLHDSEHTELFLVVALVIYLLVSLKISVENSFIVARSPVR